MEFLKSISILLIISLPSLAQMVIKETTIDSANQETITINTSVDSEGSKSEWGAAFMSLAVPGAGQFYLEEKKRGAAFLSIDLTLLAGAVLSEATSRRLFNGSMDYARRYASTNSTRGRDDKYWNDIANDGNEVTNWRDWNERYADKYRDFDNRYEDEDEWEWIVLAQKESYVDQRDRANSWHVTSLVMVGGMVVNRVVSFINARTIARRYNANIFTGMQLYPTYTMATETSSLTIIGTF